MNMYGLQIFEGVLSVLVNDYTPGQKQPAPVAAKASKAFGQTIFLDSVSRNTLWITNRTMENHHF